MKTQQLRDYENRLFALKTCFSLTKHELDADPICPHCAFRPVEEQAGAAQASDALAELDERLDELVRDWTATLLGNLEDPTVAENTELLSNPEGKDAVTQFIQQGEIPDPINPTLVKALQEVLSGLEKVILTQETLHGALVNGGIPCTMSELKDRFERYVAELTKGKNASKIAPN